MPRPIDRRVLTHERVLAVLLVFTVLLFEFGAFAAPIAIVASAILENARGDVVGDKTFGDGSVQKLIDMPDGAALILSIAKYYTPKGKAIQDAAVTPNIIVADSNDDAALPDEDQQAAPDDQNQKPKNQTDDQLKKALEVLKNRESKA